MKHNTTDLLWELQRKTENIPKGELVLKKHFSEQTDSALLSGHFSLCSDGKGLLEYFCVYPGIEVFFCNYVAKFMKDHHAPYDHVLQINHCNYGRMGWDMGDNTSIYLGPGDLSLHMMDTCADSEITFPLGYYYGISIHIDLDILSRQTPEILREAELDGTSLYRKFCENEKYTAMPANPRIEHIFSELYDLPKNMLLPYFKLKIQELLLFLNLLNPALERKLTPQLSRQVEIIQQIQHQLTLHPEHRFTIDDLAKQYLINTTTLKDTFKNVYGMPIATYMKDFRMKKAAVLLVDTNNSIADIATAVGYENQSKFSNAFRDIFQILPTAYRKQYKRATLNR